MADGKKIITNKLPCFIQSSNVGIQEQTSVFQVLQKIHTFQTSILFDSIADIKPF